MAILEQMIRSIAELDEQMRRSIAEAASAGDFTTVAALTPLAIEVSDLSLRWHERQQCAPPGLAGTDASARASTSTSPTEHTQKDGVAQRAERASGSTEYPHFLREANDLVKVGWSPRDAAPYEHRAPKTAVDATARVIAVRGRSGRRFAMDAILEGVTDKGSHGVPGYQVYAVASWLKWSGLILQHGRQGYTVVGPSTFIESTETAWRALPQR